MLNISQNEADVSDMKYLDIAVFVFKFSRALIRYNNSGILVQIAPGILPCFLLF